MGDVPGRHGAALPQTGRLDGMIVGRDRELSVLTTFVARATMNGGALLVTGDPGVGKTGLLEASADAASAAGTRVLRAAGIEFEAGMSFSGLNQVLLPLLGELEALQPIHRDALNVALGFSEAAPPGPLVISNAALTLLRHAAEARPILVVLDDLPWLDRASATVLAFIARRLEGSHVGLIGASRTGEEDLFDHAGLPELVVEPLDTAAARQLLEHRFPDLGGAARDRIVSEAQGNPLALLELPAALTPGMRSSGEPLPPTLPLGRRLQALFRSRILGVPPSTRQLLLRMALDGTGDLRLLEDGRDAGHGFDVLGPAEESHLAYFDAIPRQLRFRHPLIRSTVVDLANAEERRAAHRALAEVWVDQPERRAWHLGEATIEPDEVVASQLEAAATRILARGDAVGCVRALTRSAELSPGTAERQRRLAAAAYIAADVTGDLRNAAQVLADLRRGTTETEGSLLAAVAASAFLLQGDGDVQTAHRLLAAALEGRDLDARDPIVAEALFSLLLVSGYGGDEAFWGPFQDAMARAEHVPLAVVLGGRTFADPVRAGPAALPALDAAIAALADEADPTQIIRVGMAASYVDRLGGMREPLWRVVNDARQGGAVASGITAMVELAFDDLETGAWDEAEDLIAEVLEICEAHGYRLPTYSARFVPAVISAARGDYDRSAELSETLIGWAGPRGVIGVQQLAWQARGLAALGQGDFERAYREASRISPPGRLRPVVPHALRVLLDMVESAVRTGRGTEAAAHVAAMRDEHVAALSPRLALVVGGCEAIAAEDEEAFELFEATLALPMIARWRFDLGRIRLAYGERLRRARSMTAARVQLLAALEIFEGLAARPWVDRAAAELRATGLTKPKGGEDVLDRLTPQEFEIVNLAAAGLTNKEIGERLFLSHRTVGGHLHRAFPKLGVSTRAGLRDALAALPPEQRPRS